MKRLAVSLLVVGVLLVANLAFVRGDALGAQQTLTLNISPPRGGPGTDITISGSGAAPNLALRITLGPQADTAGGASVTQEVMPQAGGTFNTVLTLPENIPVGTYFVRAEQVSPAGFILHYYWNTFSVVGTGVDGGEPPAQLPVTGDTGLAPGDVVMALGFLLLVIGMLVGRGMYEVARGQQNELLWRP